MMEELQSKHKKELKTFESDKRIALKKIKGTAGKGKKGKELLEAAELEWADKEKEMLSRHTDEIQTFQSMHKDDDQTNDEEEKISTNEGQSNNDDNTDAVNKDDSAKDENEIKQHKQNKKLLKKQKQREKQRQYEQDLANQIKEDTKGPSPREVEMKLIYELNHFDNLNLSIQEVAADGNCLYRSIALQQASEEKEKLSFMDIRKIAADTLLQYREEYEPFCELNDDQNDFDDYIRDVRGSSEWGGHLELRAISQGLKKKIVIYSDMMDGGSSPLVILPTYTDDTFVQNDGDEIRLSYHRRYYALGEHYNAVLLKE